MTLAQCSFGRPLHRFGSHPQSSSPRHPKSPAVDGPARASIVAIAEAASAPAPSTEAEASALPPCPRGTDDEGSSAAASEGPVAAAAAVASGDYLERTAAVAAVAIAAVAAQRKGTSLDCRWIAGLASRAYSWSGAWSTGEQSWPCSC